jgi:hypothetical protein
VVYFITQSPIYTIFCDIASVLGREEGYTVKYTHSPEGVPDGKAQGKS